MRLGICAGVALDFPAERESLLQKLRSVDDDLYGALQRGGAADYAVGRIPHPMEENKKFELSDKELDAVVGGYGIGDTVICSCDRIDYCSNCGRLLKNYSVTITGVRGVLDGHTLYWVIRNCCGHKTSIIDTEIHG